MADDTVTIPKALADQVVAALWCANKTTTTLQYLGELPAEDDANFSVNFILRGLALQLDHALQFLPVDFEEAVNEASEVAHG